VKKRFIRSFLNSHSSISRATWLVVGAASLFLACANDDNPLTDGQPAGWTGSAVAGDTGTAGAGGSVSTLSGSGGMQATSPVTPVTAGTTAASAGRGGGAAGDKGGASGISGTTGVTAGNSTSNAGTGTAGKAGQGGSAGTAGTDIVNIKLDGMAASIQQGAKITGESWMEVLRLNLVGMYERDVKDVLDKEFASRGADETLAFDHIVASGPNAITLHYAGGDRKIEDGDLVLMDIGAMYQGYSSDITRTIPANGTFTKRQKELYQLVLDAQMGAAAAMKPGVQSLSDMTQWAKNFFKASPLRAVDSYGRERTMDVFFIHEISHYVGKDVHGSDLNYSSSEPVKVGRVFTLETGLYIESDGIGIRTEDDFIMTDTGAVNIWKNTIKTVEEIERFMAQPKPIVSLVPSPEAARHDPSRHRRSYTDHMDF
jgi:methionine aminopeptidase